MILMTMEVASTIHTYMHGENAPGPLNLRCTFGACIHSGGNFHLLNFPPLTHCTCMY